MNTFKASDIMTREVDTITEDTSLHEVAKLLVRHDISGLPVIDSDGVVVGMVTERDLIDTTRGHTAVPRLAFWGATEVPTDMLTEAYEASLSLRARDIMTRPVVTLSESASLEDLLDCMAEHRINRVPIVDKGRLVGIVTRDDVLRTIATLLRSRTAVMTPTEEAVAEPVAVGAAD